jgi:hypothetical protein
MSEDFFSRWSRRKRQARLEEPPRCPGVQGAEPDAADAAPQAAPEDAATAPPDAAAAPPDAAMTEEEIARLPTIDELTADTDISVFMRKGVPEGLRNAALRRMWSLDPSIRDYVSEAREYAYDWNVPGGVPGFGGALPPADEIERMAARIVGAVKEEPPIPEHAPTAGAEAAVSQKRESTSRDGDEPGGVAAQCSPPEYPDTGVRPPMPPQETVTSEPFTRTSRMSADDAQPVAVRQGASEVPAQASQRRRHGGAKPL